MEKTFMEKIDSHTMLLKSCVMSSYFESTISECSVASILYTLWLYLSTDTVLKVNIIGFMKVSLVSFDFWVQITVFPSGYIEYPLPPMG